MISSFSSMPRCTTSVLSPPVKPNSTLSQNCNLPPGERRINPGSREGPKDTKALKGIEALEESQGKI